MKILLVSSFFPLPLFSGGQVRLYNLLKNLGKIHQITLICEVRKIPSKKEIEELEKYCVKVLYFVRPKQWSLKNILKTGFSTLPFLMIGHVNTKMKKTIGEEIKNEKYDLIHCETFYVMQNIPHTTLPIVLAEHNIEYTVYQTWVNRLKYSFLKPLLNIDVLKIKHWEKYFWRKASRVIAVSEEDAFVIKSVINKEVEVVANGVDCEFFAKVVKKEPSIPTIVFVGSFKWIQNIDAANYLIKEIWPRIKKKYKKKIKLLLVGNYISSKFGKIKNNDIMIKDSVSDIRRVYSSCTLLLAPIRIGGGTKFKILESLASGLPVVTTNKGVEGLGKNTNGIYVGDKTEEIVEGVVRFLNDKDKRMEISSKEKKFVKENFDWYNIFLNLDKVYKDILQGEQ